MRVKTVQGEDNVRWECAQAYAGVAGKLSKEVTNDSTSSSVDVVCTPSGGAQTVRLQLPANWLEEMSDEELLTAIVKTEMGDYRLIT